MIVPFSYKLNFVEGYSTIFVIHNANQKVWMIEILEEERVTNDLTIILVRGLGLFFYENKGKVLIMKAISSHEINITFLSFFSLLY